MLPETALENMGNTAQDGDPPDGPEPLLQPLLTCHDLFASTDPGSGRVRNL